MLKFGDKTIYMEGVLVELSGSSVAFDLKGRLGRLRIPASLVQAEHPLRIGQEFGWDMSFPEQTGPRAAAVEAEQVDRIPEGEFATILGNVSEVNDGSVGFTLKSCEGSFKVPVRMMLCDYQIVEGQPVGFRTTAPRQLRAEPNEKYVSNLDTYQRRQAEMQAKHKN